MQHILYIGLNDKDTKKQEINTLDAYKIIQNILLSSGYDGGSLTEATGFYKHESGEIVIEKSIRVELDFAEDKKTNDAIKQIKQVLNQESVLLQTINSNNQYI